MPIVKKRELPEAQERQSMTIESKGQVLDMSAYTLPEDRSEPEQDLYAYSWLIYGPKKIGKTSLASHIDKGGKGKALFMMFEPGGKALSIYRTPVITDWAQALHIVGQLEKDSQGFTTVIIDPGSVAYQRCLDYVCKKKNISHPGIMQDFGASWAAVQSEFQELHSRLAAIDLGMVILAHDKERDIERRDGTKFSRTAPVMSGSTEEFYAGIVDIIAYYHQIGDERFLLIRGNEHVQAGCRLEAENAFATPDGEPVIRVPMGCNSREAWENVLEAFHNRQTRTYSDSDLKEHGIDIKKMDLLKAKKPQSKKKGA